MAVLFAIGQLVVEKGKVGVVNEITATNYVACWFGVWQFRSELNYQSNYYFMNCHNGKIISSIG